MVELVGPHTHYTGHQLWWNSCLHERNPIGPLPFHRILRCQLSNIFSPFFFITYQDSAHLLTFSHFSFVLCQDVRLFPTCFITCHGWANQFILCPFSFSVSVNTLEFCCSCFLVFLNTSSSINIQNPLFYHTSKLVVQYLHLSISSHSLPTDRMGRLCPSLNIADRDIINLYLEMFLHKYLIHESFFLSLFFSSSF
jgi:hypothetical protein